ncbi:hypothetical protein [Fischerella thermalis]|uniref:hypothetical protein n=1 Tax=Fischerella thermalis TaxID=372787 RepID=UPI0015F07F5C|nr:hypothetical protein [Fischerella thermalis]
MILVSKKPNSLLKNTKVRFERSQLCLADQGYRSELFYCPEGKFWAEFQAY